MSREYYACTKRGQFLKDALIERKKEAENSRTDYSFHVSPVEWRDTSGKEIAEIINSGINSFKVYMAYKDSIGLEDKDIFKVMKTVGNLGGIVTLHCEIGDEIDKLRDEYFEKGKFEPKYHPFSRPDYTEADAVRKATELAQKANCKIYIVHVSSRKSLDYIVEAQQKGQQVFAETCPQYLIFDDKKYEGNFNETAAFVFSPPLRKKEDNESLWKALKNNIISTVGTDHCPFMLEQKKQGINDFRIIPNGAGGVEHRLTLLYTYGVLENKITLNQFVDITSTKAAKLFGLYPQKGVIAEGSDADLVIWNPNKKNRISVNTHHQNSDINIYDNVNVTGESEIVILRGKVLIQNRQIINNRAFGKFIGRY